jgi:hypothetical protein
MIKIILYLILLAATHSKFEKMIEADEGWAKNLPCWKINHPIIQFILGKQLTGYHAWMLILFFIIFHSPMLFIDWSFKKELITLGFYIWYWIIEDFLWFLESENFGIRNFRKGKIDWHKRFLIGLPVSYWIGIILGSILLYLGGI